MNKKFVPLNTAAADRVNPYQIRNWEFPEFRKEPVTPEIFGVTNAVPQNYPLENVQNIMKKQFPSKAEAEGKREVKKKCEPHHSYKDCVHLRHTQNQIRDHAIAREKIIAIQEKLQPRTCYVEIEEKKSPDKYDLIKFASPTNIGNVKLASPSPSVDYVNVPSRRLVSTECNNFWVAFITSNLSAGFEKFEIRCVYQ